MKAFLFFTSIFVYTLGFAQESEEKQIIEKATWTISGSTSLSFQNNENTSNQLEITSESDSDAFLIAPSFGYALSDNLVVGSRLQYQNVKSDGTSILPSTTSSSVATNESIGLIPYIRGYKGIGKELSLYLQGEVGYNRFWGMDQQDNQPVRKSDGNTLLIGIRPGITYFLGKKLAFEASYGFLGYSFTERKIDGERYSKTNNFSLNLNTSDLLFGLAYYF